MCLRNSAEKEMKKHARRQQISFLFILICFTFMSREYNVDVCIVFFLRLKQQIKKNIIFFVLSLRDHYISVKSIEDRKY